MKYLQKRGKSIMLPVACLPLCGIWTGIGYLLCPASMQGGEITGLVPAVGLFRLNGALTKAGKNSKISQNSESLTGDLITGFPGETEEDNAATSAFLWKCRFAAMHVFPYSRRPGTPADKMPGQCPRKVKEERAHGQQRLCDSMHRDYLRACVGQTLPVLFESEEDGFCTGHSDTYMPVKVQGTGLRGQLHDVWIEGVEGETLCGTLALTG